MVAQRDRGWRWQSRRLSLVNVLAIRQTLADICPRWKHVVCGIEEAKKLRQLWAQLFRSRPSAVSCSCVHATFIGVSMTKQGAMRLALLVGVIAAVTEACAASTCADTEAVIKPPADTTVALHQSIVLQAGVGGECVNKGPTSITISSTMQWQVGDSTIVSINVLDSSHARLNGLAVGTTSVVASANGYPGSTTLVTVH
jgi:hypothetical protein